MALYADDAVLMPPNSPAFNGRAAVEKFWGGLVSMGGGTDVDLIVDDIAISGDVAIERGHYELTKPFPDSGKYVVVWRNRGGKWLITHDIFNSNLAPGS
jgi:ketosteroid isomerase-like protein